MRDPGVLLEAYYDGLQLAAAMPRSLTPVSTRELHLLGYLGCLLALFEGQPLADWGYQFALTSRGYPHSAEFEGARQNLIEEGCLDLVDTDMMEVTQRGRIQLDRLDDLSFLAPRTRWLRAATDCALALPIGSIRYALTSRVDLLAASGSGQPRDLITAGYVHRIHDERKTIEDALGGASMDLMAPAVAWISAYILGSREQVTA